MDFTQHEGMRMNTRAEQGDTENDWQKRLAQIVDIMREMSRQTDPQEMVRAYAARVRTLMPTDRRVSVSRRNLAAPWYRITRSTLWKEDVNPWTQPDRLPVLKGGLLGELLYGDEPRIIDDLVLAPDDPAAEHLAGQRSLVALPLYDDGVALNMVMFMRTEPRAFAPDQLPDLVWRTGLFGRATHNLVLRQEARKAYDELDFELKVVEGIQRSLLPPELPKISNLDLAAFYQTSHRAGGDYYDFFPLPDGTWGILIADVSGHGTPAAVMMAITHSIAHTQPGSPTPPSRMLNYLNRQLTSRYTGNSGSFVTAFYGIYDPKTRIIRYASAGHNPPRLKSCIDGTMAALDGVGGLPMGVIPDEAYDETSHQLRAGDQIVFYTDGITEAHNPRREMFGVERLDKALEMCTFAAKPLIDGVLDALAAFTEGQPADDDRTLVVAKVL